MRTIKKYVNSKEKVDQETGVVTETEKTFRIIGNSETFYMTYIEHMAKLFNITSITDIKILWKFCLLANYNNGEVNLTADKRAKLQEELNIASTQITRSINSLKELELIFGDKGTYIINPSVFWKGDKMGRDTTIKTYEMLIRIAVSNPETNEIDFTDEILKFENVQ